MTKMTPNDPSITFKVMKYTFLFLLLTTLIRPAMQAQNLQKLGHLPYAPLSLAGCWHHVDQNGGEWALVGTSAGMSIVDVSDPSQPIERFQVPGLTNNWRELRTWAGYAYVVSEATPSGVTIVNLNLLPDTIEWKVWRGNGIFQDSVVNNHTVQAVDGYLYLFDCNKVAQGAVIVSLEDPWNPKIQSEISDFYVHDGFIRGDTLWTSEGGQSQIGVYDVSDKANPQLITRFPHQPGYSHNSELSTNSKVLFTTVETVNQPLASFDVSNLDDIKQLDLYKPSKKPAGEVHNVRVFPGDFLVCPSYRGQLTVVDASHPENMIEIAWDSLGNSLVWDADPYLPSGIILATAKNEGLFIYQMNYQHAAWLEGAVTDLFSAAPLADAKVFVLNTPNADTTMVDGRYQTGAAQSGSYVVRVERNGYETQVHSNIALNSGTVTLRNFALKPLVIAVDEPDEDQAVQVSPMPFSRYLKITVPAQYQAANWQLCDSKGAVLREMQGMPSENVEFQSLQSLPDGIYILRNNKGYSQQLIKSSAQH